MLEAILDILKTGGSLNKEQMDYLLTSLSKTAAGKVPDDAPKAMTAQELETSLLGALDAVRKTPEGQAQLKDRIADRKEQRFIKRYTPFFQAIMAGADIATSLSQIRQSKEGLAGLKKPGLPPVGGIDPELDRAISEARRGTLDASRAIAPAQQELQDQYNKDLALAKAVGGGQAGTYGALGQVASLRRGRAAGSLVPMMDAVRAREQGRLDNLINMRANQANQNYLRKQQNAQMLLNQFNTESQALGGLGSAGRLNLRNSMQSLLGSVPGIAARVPSVYGDKYNDYEQRLNSSLTKRPDQYIGELSNLTADDDPLLYFSNGLY